MSSPINEPYTPPPHVPRELCWDHNLDDFPERFDDPYQACDVIHQGPDIIWANRGARIEAIRAGC